MNVQPLGRKMNVLVIEDNRFQRLALSGVLANNGKDAFDKLDMMDVIDIDLILCDIVMQEMDGLQFLSRAKSDPRYKNIPVVMMSAHDDTSIVCQCLDLGARDYLIKPLRKEVMSEIHRYLTSKIAEECAYHVQLKDLGRGTSGEVSLIKMNEKLYALKKISVRDNAQIDLEAAENEVKLLRLLECPTIIRYINSRRDSQSLLIFMEYASQGSLESAIKQASLKNEYFPDSLLRLWLTELIIGLYSVHQKNILHRDFKTANVLITHNNILKLGDFGIARKLGSTLDFARTFLGTPYYMAPEVWVSEHEHQQHGCNNDSEMDVTAGYGPPADIWSLGVVLYEMATLKKPFIGHQYMDLSDNIRFSSPAPLPPNCDPFIASVISWTLQKDPKNRPSALEVMCLPEIKEQVHNLAKYLEKNPSFPPNDAEGRALNETDLRVIQTCIKTCESSNPQTKPLPLPCAWTQIPLRGSPNARPDAPPAYAPEIIPSNTPTQTKPCAPPTPAPSLITPLVDSSLSAAPVNSQESIAVTSMAQQTNSSSSISAVSCTNDTVQPITHSNTVQPVQRASNKSTTAAKHSPPQSPLHMATQTVQQQQQQLANNKSSNVNSSSTVRVVSGGVVSLKSSLKQKRGTPLEDDYNTATTVESTEMATSPEFTKMTAAHSRIQNLMKKVPRFNSRRQVIPPPSNNTSDVKSPSDTNNQTTCTIIKLNSNNDSNANTPPSFSSSSSSAVQREAAKTPIMSSSSSSNMPSRCPETPILYVSAPEGSSSNGSYQSGTSSRMVKAQLVETDAINNKAADITQHTRQYHQHQEFSNRSSDQYTSYHSSSSYHQVASSASILNSKSSFNTDDPKRTTHLNNKTQNGSKVMVNQFILPEDDEYDHVPFHFSSKTAEGDKDDTTSVERLIFSELALSSRRKGKAARSHPASPIAYRDDTNDHLNEGKARFAIEQLKIDLSQLVDDIKLTGSASTSVIQQPATSSNTSPGGVVTTPPPQSEHSAANPKLLSNNIITTLIDTGVMNHITLGIIQRQLESTKKRYPRAASSSALLFSPGCSSNRFVKHENLELVGECLKQYLHVLDEEIDNMGDCFFRKKKRVAAGEQFQYKEDTDTKRARYEFILRSLLLSAAPPAALKILGPERFNLNLDEEQDPNWIMELEGQKCVSIKVLVALLQDHGYVTNANEALVIIEELLLSGILRQVRNLKGSSILTAKSLVTFSRNSQLLNSRMGSSAKKCLHYGNTAKRKYALVKVENEDYSTSDDDDGDRTSDNDDDTGNTEEEENHKDEDGLLDKVAKKASSSQRVKVVETPRFHRQRLLEELAEESCCSDDDKSEYKGTTTPRQRMYISGMSPSLSVVAEDALSLAPSTLPSDECNLRTALERIFRASNTREALLYANYTGNLVEVLGELLEQGSCECNLKYLEMKRIFVASVLDLLTFGSSTSKLSGSSLPGSSSLTSSSHRSSRPVANRRRHKLNTIIQLKKNSDDADDNVKLMVDDLSDESPSRSASDLLTNFRIIHKVSDDLREYLPRSKILDKPYATRNPIFCKKCIHKRCSTFDIYSTDRCKILKSYLFFDFLRATQVLGDVKLNVFDIIHDEDDDDHSVIKNLKQTCKTNFWTNCAQIFSSTDYLLHNKSPVAQQPPSNNMKPSNKSHSSITQIINKLWAYLSKQAPPKHQRNTITVPPQSYICIGGYLLSFSDIRNGILAGNDDHFRDRPPKQAYLSSCHDPLALSKPELSSLLVIGGGEHARNSLGRAPLQGFAISLNLAYLLQNDIDDTHVISQVVQRAIVSANSQLRRAARCAIISSLRCSTEKHFFYDDHHCGLSFALEYDCYHDFLRASGGAVEEARKQMNARIFEAIQWFSRSIERHEQRQLTQSDDGQTLMDKCLDKYLISRRNRTFRNKELSASPPSGHDGKLKKMRGRGSEEDMFENIIEYDGGVSSSRYLNASSTASSRFYMSMNSSTGAGGHEGGSNSDMWWVYKALLMADENLKMYGILDEQSGLHYVWRASEKQLINAPRLVYISARECLDNDQLRVYFIDYVRGHVYDVDGCLVHSSSKGYQHHTQMIPATTLL